jgi:hypothetical protein
LLDGYRHNVVAFEKTWRLEAGSHARRGPGGFAGQTAPTSVAPPRLKVANRIAYAFRVSRNFACTLVEWANALGKQVFTD